MKPTILKQDEDIVVIDKPAGLLVHADGKSTEYTVADWLVETYPETAGVGEPLVIDGVPINRSGIVHRLDKETSGVLLLAKTQQGFAHLKEQFQNRSIKKIYYAFIIGVPKENRGLIDLPIGRSRTDFRQYSAEKGSRGMKREAITRYLVKESGHGYSFVQIFPETGRTHQIRVHFKAIRHPLVGDSLYGTSLHNDLGFTRTALHAYSVEYMTLSGEKVLVEAPFPEDFLQAQKLLRN